jgi:hypothetical protein
MFGPNAHYTPVTPGDYSHRSQYALDLVKRVKEKLTDLFHLQDYDLLFIPGPATVAMQTVIDSAHASITVLGDGKFDSRWKSMVEGRLYDEWGDYSYRALLYTMLETSQSRRENHDVPPLLYTDPPTPYHGIIVDAVSSFPFYPIPEHASVFVTTSCKQLGGPPGMGIVGVRKDAWHLFKGTVEAWSAWSASSYINIQNHRYDQFYTTAPINVLEVLDATLSQSFFDCQRHQIELVCDMLDEVLPKDMTIGERHCPVITIKRKEFDDRFPDIADMYQLYPETNPDSPYHIFTYSGHLLDYAQFAQSLKNHAR